MASYEELRSLFGDTTMRARVEVAVVLKAHAILQEEAPSADRLAWARGILSSSKSEAEAMLKYALASNASLTLEQLRGASEAALLTAVGEAVDKLYA